MRALKWMWGSVCEELGAEDSTHLVGLRWQGCPSPVISADYRLLLHSLCWQWAVHAALTWGRSTATHISAQGIQFHCFDTGRIYNSREWWFFPYLKWVTILIFSLCWALLLSILMWFSILHISVCKDKWDISLYGCRLLMRRFTEVVCSVNTLNSNSYTKCQPLSIHSAGLLGLWNFTQEFIRNSFFLK